MDPKVLTALVAAAASVSAALLSLAGVSFSVAYGRKTQRDLETLKSQLAEKKSGDDARRDYQYDARRRLYKECEPSIFRLLDACDNAHQRIGKLLQSDGSELATEEYRLSTLYRLLLPAVVFTHVREKLTVFDLSIEPRIHLQYEIGRLIGSTLSDDKNLAASGSGPLTYRPRSTPPPKEAAEPRIYMHQGISPEHLEALSVALRRAGDEVVSHLSFSEFWRMRLDKQHALFKVVLDLDYFLRSFTPSGRPVLCRLLYAQMVLFELMARTRFYEEADWSRFLTAAEGTFEVEKLYANDPSFQSAMTFLRPKLKRIHDRVHNLQRGREA